MGRHSRSDAGRTPAPPPPPQPPAVERRPAYHPPAQPPAYGSPEDTGSWTGSYPRVVVAGPPPVLPRQAPPAGSAVAFPLGGSGAGARPALRSVPAQEPARGRRRAGATRADLVRPDLVPGPPVGPAPRDGGRRGSADRDGRGSPETGPGPSDTGSRLRPPPGLGDTGSGLGRLGSSDTGSRLRPPFLPDAPPNGRGPADPGSGFGLPDPGSRLRPPAPADPGPGFGLGSPDPGSRWRPPAETGAYGLVDRPDEAPARGRRRVGATRADLVRPEVGTSGNTAGATALLPSPRQAPVPEPDEVTDTGARRVRSAFHVAPDTDARPDARTDHDDENDEDFDEPSLVLQWGIFFAQTLTGAAVGLGVWLGFYRLWSTWPFYAAPAVGAAMIGMLVVARTLRRRYGHELDLLTAIVTIGIGTVLTVLPAAFTLQSLG